MKKTYILGIIGLLVVALVASTAFAFDFKNIVSEENRDTVKDAIVNNDFYAWQEAMINELTEERFEKLVEMYQNMENKITVKENVHAALDTNDYDAWVAAIAELKIQPKIASVINEDNFYLVVELHEARENNDNERVKEILNEFGVEGHGLKSKMKKYMNPLKKPFN